MDGSENPEFARLESRSSRDDTTVVIEAGTSRRRCRSCTTSSRARETPAAVSSSSRWCARACPDYPVVADTALTAETREDFPDGVDVLAGKAAWSGGDVSDLASRLWGDPDAFGSTARS